MSANQMVYVGPGATTRWIDIGRKLQRAALNLRSLACLLIPSPGGK